MITDERQNGERIHVDCTYAQVRDVPDSTHRNADVPGVLVPCEVDLKRKIKERNEYPIETWHD